MTMLMATLLFCGWYKAIDPPTLMGPYYRGAIHICARGVSQGRTFVLRDGRRFMSGELEQLPLADLSEKSR